MIYLLATEFEIFDFPLNLLSTTVKAQIYVIENFICIQQKFLALHQFRMIQLLAISLSQFPANLLHV